MDMVWLAKTLSNDPTKAETNRNRLKVGMDSESDGHPFLIQQTGTGGGRTLVHGAEPRRPTRVGSAVNLYNVDGLHQRSSKMLFTLELTDGAMAISFCSAKVKNPRVADR